MLTAINKITKEKLFFDDWNDRIDQLRKIELVDPFFFQSVFVRKPHFRKYSSVRGHFVSKGQEIDIKKTDLLMDDDYFIRDGNIARINESYEHMEGKKEITNYVLNNVLNGYENLKVEYEYRVHIRRKNKYRIIDSAIIFPSGLIIALECQLSTISQESLLERIQDYNSLDIDSLWFLGKKADTKENKNLLYSLFGEIPPTITFS